MCPLNFDEPIGKTVGVLLLQDFECLPHGSDSQSILQFIQQGLDALSTVCPTVWIVGTVHHIQQLSDVEDDIGESLTVDGTMVHRFSLPHLNNNASELWQVASVLACVSHDQTHYDSALIYTLDRCSVDGNLLRLLKEEYIPDAITLFRVREGARYRGSEAFPAIYPVSFLPIAQEGCVEGVTQVIPWVGQCPLQFVDFPESENHRLSASTPTHSASTP